jgi:predicted metal-binding membrane protein
MLAERLRAMGQGHWLALYALVLGSWALLFAMQLPADLVAAARLFGPELWEALCSVRPGVAGAPTLFLMWAAMAAGMMAPTALPAFATYDDLRAARAGSRAGFAALAVGYLAVWLGFAALATGAQIALAGAGLLTPLGASASAGLTAGLLAAAGLWQFSPAKGACLVRCRAPFGFFLAHWDAGPWRMGLRLGLVCLGCCWALMALAFVGGVMNLAFMGGAMVLMTLEKLPVGRYLTRPLGVALLGAAALVLVT